MHITVHFVHLNFRKDYIMTNYTTSGVPRLLRKASMSVEAVFITPLILFVLFMVLFFSFYIHQRIWFTEAAYEAVLTPGNEREKAQLLLKETPLALNAPNVNVAISKQQIQTTYEGKILPSEGSFSLNYSVSAKAEVLKPVEYIRNLRSIGRLQDGKDFR